MFNMGWIAVGFIYSFCNFAISEAAGIACGQAAVTPPERREAPSGAIRRRGLK